MDEPALGAGLRQFQQDHPHRYAAYALAVYTAVIYVWALGIHPLGLDYAYMSDPHRFMPPVIAGLFRAQMTLFGARTVPYHLLNIAVLYLCAVLVFLIGRQLIAGPAWLSLLAAVIFMANPLHRDAAFMLAGIESLVPAFLALLALYGYFQARRQPGGWSFAAPVIFACATLVSPQNLFLFVPILLAEILLPTARRPWAPLIACGCIFIVAVYMHRETLQPGAFHPGRMWAPVYLALQPAKFLPGTMRQFAAMPVLAWLSAALVLAFALWIVWKTRSRVFLWALLAALLVRVAQGAEPFDFVHLVGGRRMILSTALLLIALCELFRRMIQHPKWLRPVVTGTTIWCMLLFAMQIHAAFVWRDAGTRVKAFQHAAAAHADDAPLAILPDVYYYRGAPAMFAEAVRYTTPFSRGHDVLPVIRINVTDPDVVSVEVEAYSHWSALVKVHAQDVAYLWYPDDTPLPVRPRLPIRGYRQPITLEVVETGARSVLVRIDAYKQNLPPLTLSPLPILRERDEFNDNEHSAAGGRHQN
jgi:hypothetical protein